MAHLAGKIAVWDDRRFSEAASRAQRTDVYFKGRRFVCVELIDFF
jgi:hypothetical protein